MKRVLYIEDNIADIALFEEALKDNKSNVQLEVITDADDVMEYIKTASQLADNSIPDLIITDVSLPKINGQEIILELKKSEQLKDITVLAYSTSSYPKDIENCLKNGASDYYQKPMNYTDTCSLIKEIFNKWL